MLDIRLTCRPFVVHGVALSLLWECFAKEHRRGVEDVTEGGVVGMLQEECLRQSVDVKTPLCFRDEGGPPKLLDFLQETGRRRQQASEYGRVQIARAREATTYPTCVLQKERVVAYVLSRACLQEQVAEHGDLLDRLGESADGVPRNRDLADPVRVGRSRRQLERVDTGSAGRCYQGSASLGSDGQRNEVGRDSVRGPRRRPSGCLVRVRTRTMKLLRPGRPSPGWSEPTVGPLGGSPSLSPPGT